MFYVLQSIYFSHQKVNICLKRDGDSIRFTVSLGSYYLLATLGIVMRTCILFSRPHTKTTLALLRRLFSSYRNHCLYPTSIFQQQLVANRQKYSSMLVQQCVAFKYFVFNMIADAVGLYVPGGTAVLPSSALMLTVPAALAGCSTIVLATPPRPDGSISPEVRMITRINFIEVAICGCVELYSVLLSVLGYYQCLILSIILYICQEWCLLSCHGLVVYLQKRHFQLVKSTRLYRILPSLLYYNL